jgi:hypothetical protein
MMRKLLKWRREKITEVMDITKDEKITAVKNKNY